MSLTFHQLIFLFFVYSFTGWIIEVIFRSINNKKFINPGFNKGPYLPIYGFSAVIIFLTYTFISAQPVWYKIIIYFIITSLTEYFAGEFLLQVFNKRYWDYRDNKFNIRGHVCLSFSIYWVILAFVFEKLLYNISVRFIENILLSPMQYFNIAMISIFIADFSYSSGIINGIKNHASRMRPLPDIIETYSEKFSNQLIVSGSDVQIKLNQLNSFIIKNFNTQLKNYNRITESLISRISKKYILLKNTISSFKKKP